MGHQLNVYVLDSDGDPVAGTEARIYIDGIWKGGTLDAHTDNDGHPKIETAADHEDSREPSSRVHRQSFGPYRIGGEPKTVQLD